MNLSFTTLGCPAWSWDRILREAVAMDFGGVELRGIGGELETDRLAPFQPERIADTAAELRSLGLNIPCIDTSCTFLDSDAEATYRSGCAAIDIAQGLGTPAIRTFGDRIPQGMGEDEAVGIVARGLQRLSEYAEGRGVSVLLETHGNFAQSRLMLQVFEQVTSPAAAVLWDISNPYEFGESVAHTWEALRRLVRHTHIKDTLPKGSELVPVLPGRGTVPIGEAVAILRQAGFDGWLSFEWEKRWYEDIEEPEVAFLAYMEFIKPLL